MDNWNRVQNDRICHVWPLLHPTTSTTKKKVIASSAYETRKFVTDSKMVWIGFWYGQNLLWQWKRCFGAKFSMPTMREQQSYRNIWSKSECLIHAHTHVQRCCSACELFKYNEPIIFKWNVSKTTESSKNRPYTIGWSFSCVVVVVVGTVGDGAAVAVFYAVHALKLTKDITEDSNLCINKFIQYTTYDTSNY